MNELLITILNQFQVSSNFVKFEELNSGHINDTYLIITTQKPHYVLQKINGEVFTNASELISNKVCVSRYLQNQLSSLPLEKIQQKVLSFVTTKTGDFYHLDSDGNYWNLSVFIEDSMTYEKTPNTTIAFEAGIATGSFLALTEKFDANQLFNLLPNFHSVKHRYQQFLKASQSASLKRMEETILLRSFVVKRYKEMIALDRAISENELPTRLVHGDTKISNILFSKSNRSLCLIDTDTVMKGTLAFDYGDAIRTICNTEDEDEKKVHLIDFNLAYFKAYTKGFLTQLNGSIAKEELKYLAISIKIMPFIMGLRFLTDFLNDNIYYKTSYLHHNYDRANNQFTLVRKIDEKYNEIEAFIELFHQ